MLPVLEVLSEVGGGGSPPFSYDYEYFSFLLLIHREDEWTEMKIVDEKEL